MGKDTSLNNNLTAIIIAKDEAKRIEKCLQSISWVDEIILVDNGSCDSTQLIAKRWHARIVECKLHDFSALRNIGKQESTGDWILYVDADEIIPPELRDEIKKKIMKFPDKESFAAFSIKRKNTYLGSSWPYQDTMKRLFWKKALICWHGEIHETALVNGKIGILRESLIHNTHRNLEEMVKKTNEWSIVEAKLRFASHHPMVTWWRFLRVMITGFYASFVQQHGWKAGAAGWIESIYQAFSMFITYAKLWELQNNSKSSIKN